MLVLLLAGKMSISLDVLTLIVGILQLAVSIKEETFMAILQSVDNGAWCGVSRLNRYTSAMIIITNPAPSRFESYNSTKLRSPFW